MSEVRSFLEALSKRMEDIERRFQEHDRRQRSRSPIGRTNLAGAARYLNMSDETLRQRHARGEGPKRGRNGRQWSYAYSDLDEYAASQA
jgi:hypothetical protein